MDLRVWISQNYKRECYDVDNIKQAFKIINQNVINNEHYGLEVYKCIDNKTGLWGWEEYEDEKGNTINDFKLVSDLVVLNERILYKVGDIVKIVNLKDINCSFRDTSDWIGIETEIISMHNSYSFQFLLKGKMSGIYFDEENVELIKSISQKESLLKSIDRDLININEMIHDYNQDKEKLIQLKAEILTV